MGTALVVVIAFVFGAIVGSFLNVVLWRVPRGESIVSPSSHCPACGTPLRPGELIPVVSWVALGGRCRTCRTSISVRYPLVELATGLLFAAVAAALVA
jgi:leader peptidase (prepilin peptidase)/N-methyltransferase